MFHPKNQEVKKILLKNFRILADDPTTKEIFNTKPLSALCVYRRDTSLRDILVHSTLSSRADDTQATPAGPFPCHRPRCRTCDITERTTTVTNANGDIRLKGRFDCTAADVVYVITCQRCQAVHWRNRSKAFGSFRGTPSFSGGLQTEPPLPGRWFPHGRTFQST